MPVTRYLGLTLPLNRGQRGYFQSTTNALENEKSKFINLILTKKGERPANPNFGCDLWRLLFEHKNGEIQELAQQYVQEAVSNFMDYLILEEIRVENIDTFANDNVMTLYVRYSFSNNQLVSDEVQLQIGSSSGQGLVVSGRTVTRNF